MCERKYYLWMAIFIYCGLFRKIQTARLLCYINSLDNYIQVPLDNPTMLLNSSCFDSNRPTLCYTFGYNGKVGGPATTAVLKAHLEKKKRNVMLVDWEHEAKTTSVGIAMSYFLFAAPNAKLVGTQVGNAFVALAEAKRGLNMDDVHFMGHSLGAHLMGHAGRATREKGHPVGRITGLDPARALYEGSFAVKTGLDRSCAKFVDIVHTNAGELGSNKSSGSVDVWFNYNANGLQPGCPEGNYDMFSKEGLCSHNRAWEYYIESLVHGTAFPASAAENYECWLTQGSNATSTIYFGDLVNTRARGNYFLLTNDKPPYGRGKEGAIADEQARTRRSTPTPTLLRRIRQFMR